MPQKQERFMWMEINFVLEKNGGHTPSSLGSKLIVMVRQADKISTWSLQFFKIQQLQY